LDWRIGFDCVGREGKQFGERVMSELGKISSSMRIWNYEISIYRLYY
jgi:hypothetical protein